MTLPSSSPESLGLDPARLQRLETWLDQQVESQRLAGASVLVARKGSIGLFRATGSARVAGDQSVAQPFARDTLVRLYSMTKPVTTVAAMMLYEQGHFQLDDPVAKYLPAFSDTPVWDGTVPASGSELLKHVVSQESPMTIRQLMTHTAGLTYSFMEATPVDRYYREHELTFPGSLATLADLVDRLAMAPLLCQPGTQWNYSVATDVLGRLVEVWSGLSLSDYFREFIFRPLRMHDTGFHVEPDKHHRFADCMGPGEDGAAPVMLDPAATSGFLRAPTLYSGGGGLTGSIDDFARFAQMLLNRGELEGVRLLSRKTVEFMRQNHLPGNGDMASMGQAVWSETSYSGIGFGLGFAVVLDPVEAQMMTSAGEHHWGGAASTFFWVDPAEDMIVVFLTQLYPSSTYPIRRELRSAVYQALVD